TRSVRGSGEAGGLADATRVQPTRPFEPELVTRRRPCPSRTTVQIWRSSPPVQPERISRRPPGAQIARDARKPARRSRRYPRPPAPTIATLPPRPVRRVLAVLVGDRSAVGRP